MDATFLAFGAAVIGTLVTCVAYLHRQSTNMGRSLDAVNRLLGRMEGLVIAISGCKGGNPCPFTERLPSEFASTKTNTK